MGEGAFTISSAVASLMDKANKIGNELVSYEGWFLLLFL